MTTFRRRASVAVLSALASCVVTAVFGSVAADGQAPSEGSGQTAVVELFTSQGCPKCPPADKVIGDLARSPSTIALSFPVAIWDYIGWKDTLAAPAFLERQRGYAAARGDQLVYTPQAVIDGLGVETGVDRSAILKDMDALHAERRAMDVGMRVSESDGKLHVAIDAGHDPSGERTPVGVYVLRVARTQTVTIGHGDNSGRRVTYTNVVRAMNRLGGWTGAPAQFDVLDLKGVGEGYVVLLQTGTPDKPGPILAAAKTADL